MSEVLDHEPEFEEGDDSVHAPDDPSEVTEDDLEDVSDDDDS